MLLNPLKEIKIAESLKSPYLEGVNARHWISEKAKVYTRFLNGFPDKFDSIRVEYKEPDAGWIDTTFSLNGENKLEAPLSDWNNPLGDIVKWLENLIIEDKKYEEKTLNIDCERGCYLILHYEPLNCFGVEYGILFVYGSWTEDEENHEYNFSAFCLKAEMIDAIYTPMINQWKGYLKTKRYNASGEEDYQWSLPHEYLESPQQLLDLIQSCKIEEYLKKEL